MRVNLTSTLVQATDQLYSYGTTPGHAVTSPLDKQVAL